METVSNLAVDVFVNLAVILLVAFMVEAAVEAVFGTIFKHIGVINPYSWALIYISFAAGVLMALYYRFDLVALLAEQLSGLVQTPSVPGMILTGLMIGRGSQAIHDLIMKFFFSKEKPPAPVYY